MDWVLPAGFEQQHAVSRGFAESIGEHAAGGAGTDDDVVVHEQAWETVICNSIG